MKSSNTLKAIITGADRVDPSGDGVDSVMLADLMNTLNQLGVSFPAHRSIGNRGRGIPGTVWVVIHRDRARAIVDTLNSVVGTKGYEAIARQDPLNIFVQGTEDARRGIEYLLRALAIPEGFEGTLIRLN
jgi:hypothetical protein